MAMVLKTGLGAKLDLPPVPGFYRFLTGLVSGSQLNRSDRLVWSGPVFKTVIMA